MVAASLLVGYALTLLCRASTRAAPAAGLSVLLVVSFIAIKLPGRGATAVTAIVIVVVIAGVVIAVRRPWAARLGARAAPLTAVVTILVAAFGAAIPFLANGRVGLLGVSLDNDTSTHLRWAQALRHPVVGQRYGLNSAYPLGPHSLADVLSSGLGARLDLALTGMMIGTVVLTALVGSSALRGESWWKRVTAGVMAAVLYLLAAYYGEGAFKEQIMALLLLATVLALEDFRSDWERAARARWLVLLPVAIMFAAAIYTYSYPALAWLGLTVVFWLMLEAVTRPRWWWRRRGQLSRDKFMAIAIPVAAAALLFVILVAPTAPRIVSFAQGVGVSPAASGVVAASNLGNLAHALSAYESLGIWNRPDFRFLPDNVFHAGEYAALAVGVLLFGLVWSLGRRRYVLPAALAACAIVYWRANAGQSPYLSAKALVIPAGVVAVIGVRALLCRPESPLPRWASFSRLAVAIAFVGLAVYSSYQALRDEPVWGSESTAELASLSNQTRDRTLLFLGHSDFVSWVFGESKMSAIAADTVSLAQAGARPNKPYVYGTAFDFDTVDPATINRFDYIITTNTTYASQPPSGFELVRRLPMYELWKRAAPIQNRQVLDPPGAPGAVLNCRDAKSRALSRRPGVAAVMAAPVLAPVGGIPPGGVARARLELPAGRWDLSLQYTSAVPLHVAVAGADWTMPAYDDRPGPVFAVGSVTATGAPVVVTIRADRPSFMSGPDLQALVPQVIAVPSSDTRLQVPLARACGRYVDWYRLST